MVGTVRMVNDSLALLSMRDSDFDAYSAFGEIIDNSIQANASNICIKVEVAAPERGRYEVIRSISFGDDGDGMDREVLHRCLQLGYSSRYNDRSGIGRFGVGMTLAAINQCKRIEVYSKQQDGTWLFTYADLDEMTRANAPIESIPEPMDKEPPAELLALVKGATGTVVRWSKYDRQPASAAAMKPEMHKWMGRTFRNFIWRGVTLSIDGEEVKAIDPLYMRWDRTRFPDDPPGTEVDPIEIEWNVPDDVRGGAPGRKSTIRIRLSLANEQFWPKQGAGNSREAKERFFGDNEGISIMRNGREVLYDTIPHWPGGADWFTDKDRWWGCEISFDAELDRAFTVKNIKRGAVPNSELKKAIYDQIVPTVRGFRAKIDQKWAAAKAAQSAAKSQTDAVPTGHEKAERIAKVTSTDKSAIDSHLTIDDEAKKLVEQLKQGVSDAEKAAWVAKWKSQPFTIMEGSWGGATFIEAQHLGGSDVIRYNRNHPFFQEMFSIIDGLSADDNLAALKLKSLIDILIIAYSKAEAKFDHGLSFPSEDFVEQLRGNWGMYLKSYLRSWRDEFGTENVGNSDADGE
jgi:hypothetical protein